MTIRPTQPDELARVVALEAAEDTSQWLAETGLAWHQRALADPDQEHLVAVEEAEVIGFVVFAGLRDGGGAIELRRMVVDTGLRRTGRGREVLRAALVRAYSHHQAQRVWLDVKAQNARARALYESEGFRLTDIIANAITEADGTTSDLHVMVRPANP